jgi:proteasome lid subunit RPN8/RPN11
LSVSETDVKLGWKLSSALAADLVAHARACYPREACGMLAGNAAEVLRQYPARNVASGTDRYMVAAEEQRAIFAEIARMRWKLLAIYHSHPLRAAVPSLNDVRLVAYPQAVMLIVSLADWEHPDLRGYHVVDGQPREVPLALSW